MCISKWLMLKKMSELVKLRGEVYWFWNIFTNFFKKNNLKTKCNWFGIKIDTKIGMQHNKRR